jgi:hypothetical protein
MTHRYTSIFSYYGGKSKLAHLYPKPRYDRICEPFAGAAAYSLRYCEHPVTINDLDPITTAIWSFLLSPTAADMVELYVPTTVPVGAHVSTDILPDQMLGSGLLPLLQAEANRGTQGARGVHDQVTGLAAECWPRLKPRLLYWIPKIAHWHLYSIDYATIRAEGEPATWFVDPPYSNTAGGRYRLHSIDYTKLATLCYAWPGQVIVCENSAATWLTDWVPLTTRRGIKSSYQQSTAVEVYKEILNASHSGPVG